ATSVPVWRCRYGCCCWSPSCAPKPQPDVSPYKTPRPHFFFNDTGTTDTYTGPYGSPGPQVYSPAPQPYVGPYPSQGSGPYGPEGYSGPADRMRWMVGPQPYGM